MAFSKKTWKDRQVEHPGRRRLSNTGTTDVYDVTREEGLVIEEGDALNAANFNDLENRVSSAFSESALKEIFTLTHSKSGTTHALTGLSGVSGTVSAVFTATAAYTAGDTFTVDGESYTIQLSNGETAEENLFVAGAAVPIVLDTAGKKVNFKAAGGQKLPAETLAIVKIFTANGTFTVPQTGNYKITVIGKGGDGSNAVQNGIDYEYYAGGGGGSGGAAELTAKLTKGESYPITVSKSTASFGSLVSATAGKNASGRTGGTAGTASGGSKLTSENGESGGAAAWEDAVFSAGRGGSVTCRFVPDKVDNGGSANRVSSTDGKSTEGVPETNLFYPFGTGGGGGGYRYGSSYNSMGQGAAGCSGAVIVELVL